MEISRPRRKLTDHRGEYWKNSDDYRNGPEIKCGASRRGGYANQRLGRELKGAEPDRDRDQEDRNKFLGSDPTSVRRRYTVEFPNLIRQKQKYRDDDGNCDQPSQIPQKHKELFARCHEPSCGSRP